MTTALPETRLAGTDIPADQRWFWTDCWQAAEPADIDIAAGRTEWLVTAAIDAHTEGNPAIGDMFFAMAADMAYRLREAGVAVWGGRLDVELVEGVTV